MAVTDALYGIFIIVALWFTINLFWNHIELPIYNAINGSAITAEQRETNDYIHNAQTNNVQLFAQSAAFVIISVITTMMIRNALTSLNPLMYGLFTIVFFLTYYLAATTLLPNIIPQLQNIVVNDVAPDYLTFILGKWQWLFIAGFVGSILGYMRGADSGN